MRGGEGKGVCSFLFSFSVQRMGIVVAGVAHDRPTSFEGPEVRHDDVK